MSTFKVEGYETRNEELEGWPIRIASYQLGDRFACKVDNVSPGAVIARGEGQSREEAEQDALDRAARKLRTTRRIEVLATKVDEISKELQALKEDV